MIRLLNPAVSVLANFVLIRLLKLAVSVLANLVLIRLLKLTVSALDNFELIRLFKIKVSALFNLRFNAAKFNAESGLSISDVLSTLSIFKVVFNPAIEVSPVPPLATLKVPVILFASNDNIFSFVTLLLAILFVVILSSKMIGKSAVPPKSPANLIVPLVVVVAGNTAAFVIDLLTNAVVASCAVFVPVVAVGATGVPENDGEFKFAFKFIPILVFKSFKLLAPVPPFAIGKIPVIVLALSAYNA